MTKYLVDVELKASGIGYPWGKTVVIGIYDTFEEAVKEGNKVLESLPKGFETNDRFEVKGRLHVPTRLVVKLDCPKGVQMFSHIQTLNFLDLKDAIKEVLDKKKEVNKT